ncbi:hypothetical protein F4054_23300 [Candidatus Poribacteria bacterium]|nr:hypothetical protein [Candidatus Poribacteria bacterium]MYK25179.1 hypothetical protein [Candidatus Poribacteria bacterium]
MKLKITIIYALSLFTLFTTGCQQLNDQMKTGPDDTVSVSVDDVNPGEIFYTGTVFIGDAGDRFGTDAYALNSATITDDMLNISVSYSGGCEDHQFTLVASDTFLESFPVQLHVSIAHDANGDTCEAYPTENYRFDLTPIKTMYQAAYRQEAGTIILRLKNAPDGEHVYEFTM